MIWLNGAGSESIRRTEKEGWGIYYVFYSLKVFFNHWKPPIYSNENEIDESMGRIFSMIPPFSFFAPRRIDIYPIILKILIHNSPPTGITSIPDMRNMRKDRIFPVLIVFRLAESNPPGNIFFVLYPLGTSRPPRPRRLGNLTFTGLC